MLPKEIRPLNNPGNVNNQGFLTCKVEILERKYAIANPMVPIDPPSYDMFDLRVVVWDAVDVKAKDESFFGGGVRAPRAEPTNQPALTKSRPACSVCSHSSVLVCVCLAWVRRARRTSS